MLLQLLATWSWTFGLSQWICAHSCHIQLHPHKYIKYYTCSLSTFHSQNRLIKSKLKRGKSNPSEVFINWVTHSMELPHPCAKKIPFGEATGLTWIPSNLHTINYLRKGSRGGIEHTTTWSHCHMPKPEKYNRMNGCLDARGKTRNTHIFGYELLCWQLSWSKFDRPRCFTCPKMFQTEPKVSHPNQTLSHPNACEGFTRESWWGFNHYPHFNT